MTDLIGLSHK